MHRELKKKDFGIHLDPYLCTDEELLNSIEIMINNNELLAKIKNISHRIQSDNSIEKLPKLIEDLVIYTKIQ